MEMEDGMDESSSNEYDSSTDSSGPSSPDDSSLGGSDNSSSSSEESSVPTTKLEDCKVNGTVLQLPQGLSEQEDVFQQLLSHETWQNLSAANRDHLKKFLPTFESNNDNEQETTLQLLFGGENIRFGNPLKDFHRNLKNGYYRPDIARMRFLLRKALNREYNYSQKRYYFRVMKSVLISRQKLLQTANILPPGINPKVPRLPAPPRTQQLSTREYRTRRRYFQELRAVRQEVGESGHSSEDENYPEGPPAQMNKKLKRRLTGLETSLCPEMRRVVSTLAAKPAGLDLAANVTASNNPYEISDEAYRNMLIRHKKRRLTGDTHPELNCLGRSLHDVVDRANRVISKRGLLSGAMKFESPQILGKQHPKQVQKRRNSKVQQESAIPSPSPLLMADSSDTAESDDDVISVTRLTDDTDKPQKNQRDRKLPDKEKENESKEWYRDREWEREREKEKVLQVDKDREKDEWDKFIGNDLEKHSVGSSPRTSATKLKKNNVLARSGKPNSLSGLPTSRRILKGELEDAVDSLLNSDQKPPKSIQHDSKPSQNVKEQFPQSPQMQSKHQQLQEQLKEEDVGVKVVQATTSFPAAQDSSLLPDLSNIDMMSLPVDIEEPEGELNIEYAPATPSLMQDTHSCFFALLRDLICSAREQSMSLSSLQAGLRKWQESPISPLNDWYPQAANSGGWVASLTSALTFLSGQLPDMHPDEFVPYLEYKPSIRKYQWIGAGRDSDNLLMPLCTYWLERRDEAAEMQSRESKRKQDQFNAERDLDNIYVDDDEMGAPLPVDPSNDYPDRIESPLPSCNPTAWVVVPTTPEEKREFRAQELERFANPLRAFTYKMHGYESVVGPLRGVYSTGSGNVKPRGHSLLVSDRPNYVTILALVRDAVARLPNGQGTRMDICELLKDSQYLKPGATEQTVQSVVSGALDRLHYEPDPCVKYEPKRKIWICLHRSRTMEEYEQMHQQQQGMGKPKIQRKSGGRIKKERENKAETKAAVAAVTSGLANTPRLIPQVEAEVTNMPTGLHTIQVTTRPAVSLSSGSLWNTPMELPLLPSSPSSASSIIVSAPTTSTTLATPSQSARTILTGRLPSSPVAGRKSTKKQSMTIDSAEAGSPIAGTNVRSVLSSPSAAADGTKTSQQQILMGGRIISSTAGRKSLVMTSSSGVPQVVQLATPTKQSIPGTVISSQGTVLLSGSPTMTVSANAQCSSSSTSSTTAQWATVATSPSSAQRPTMVIQQPPQEPPKKAAEVKRTLTKPTEGTVQNSQVLTGGLTQTVSLDANVQRQLKQQQLLLMKQRQQQQAAQQQAAQQQAAQQQAAQQQAAQQQAAQQQAVQQQAAQQQAAQQQAAQQQAAQQQAAQQQAAQQQAAQQQAAQQQAAQQQQLQQQQQIQQHQQFQLQMQQQQQQLQQQQQRQLQQQQLQQQQLQQQQLQQQQQQIQLQQQLQAQQLQQVQQVQPPLQALQTQDQPQGQELDQQIHMELDHKHQEQLQQHLQKQQLQTQQKVTLSASQQKQIQQQTLQLLQQQLKDKPGALSLSNIQLVDQSGTVMAVQSSDAQAAVGRPRQNLVLVRQAGGDQAAQLTAMVQKQQQLLLLKQKQQQSVKDLSEAQQQQLQLRQRQVQELLKQQLKAQQQAGKVQTAAAQAQLQQQIVVVSGTSQQQVKQQLTAQQKQAQTQLVVLKQPRGQGQLVNAVGGILPQQMFVVKTKAGAGQKQVLTQLTAEQQAGLLALQRQQQQLQLQPQQQQLHQPQQQQIVQQQQLQQQPPPLHLQQQPVTTAINQLQLTDQSQQQRQQIQQVLQSQGKGVRGTSILGQGILTTAALTSSTVTTASAKQGPPPMVAKVVTNSHGQQLITMEALQAQNKGTLRVAPAGSKVGQPNQLIQIAGSGAGGVPQFAVVSQGNIISLASSINTQRIVPQALTLSASGTTTTAVTASKMSAGTVNATIAQSSGSLRMVGGTGLNIAHIGGKPVLLASKQQGLQGQNVILTSPGGAQQTVLLASQPLRPAGAVSGSASQPAAGAAGSNAVVLQQAGGTQQILLPPGFQGGTINLKGIQGIQGLQGLKVIPVAQATQADGTKGRSQMFARIISPSAVRATGAQQQQSISVAVAGASNAGTTTVAAAPAPQPQVTSVREQSSLL